MIDYYKTGELVGLRGFVRDDLKVYKNWLDNSGVTHYMEMGSRPTTEYILEQTYKEATESNENIVMTIVDKESNKAIGTTGLYIINWPGRRAQFRIMIGEPDYFNKGYGTEATKLVVDYGFNRLNMETIYLGANEDNKAAIKSYEKSGFVHEGIQRNFIYNNGKYYNAVMMSIIRSDFYREESQN